MNPILLPTTNEIFQPHETTVYAARAVPEGNTPGSFRPAPSGLAAAPQPILEPLLIVNIFPIAHKKNPLGLAHPSGFLSSLI